METGKNSNPTVLDRGDSKDLYPNPKDRKVFLIAGIACIAIAPAVLFVKGRGTPGLAAIILLAVGAFLIYSVIYARKRVKYEEFLLNSGDCYWADITDCIVNKIYNRRSSRYYNSYTLVCQYKDKSDIMRECKRYALGYDPRPYLDSGQVKVYVDPAKPMNPNNYMIDVIGSMTSQPEQPS